MNPLPHRPLLPASGLLAMVPTSSPLPGPEALQPAWDYFRRRGYRVRRFGGGMKSDRFLAGSDHQRAKAFQAAFSDDRVVAVLAARGGYGSARLLPFIDFDVLAAHPKPFIGFSDLTALNLALLQRAHLASYTGLNAFPDLESGRMNPRQEESFWSVLRGNTFRMDGLAGWQPGRARGLLVGGCLSLLTSLLGTPWMPSLRGALLLLEDVNEEPYRLDRMLTQCRLAGVFEAVAGVVLGSFERCTPRNPKDGAAAEVLREITAWVDGPVAAAAPYGHRQPRCVLPVGAPARLEVSGDSACLILEGEPQAGCGASERATKVPGNAPVSRPRSSTNCPLTSTASKPSG